MVFPERDGNNTQVSFSTSQNPLQIFGVGNFSITLNASNSAEYNITPWNYWINVSATGSAPVATFSADNTSISVGDTVAFTDASTIIITGYTWDFGDITTSPLQNPSHRYIATGTYTVRSS